MPAFCTRCNREIRSAECKLAFGKTWHNLCFSCRTCRKLLDSHTAQPYCGDLYCESCHASLASTKESQQNFPSNTARPTNTSSNWSRQAQESIRLRGGGNEIEVNSYHEGKEKQCSYSTCAQKYNTITPSEESVQLRSNTTGTRDIVSVKPGCSTSGGFNGSVHKIADGQTDHSECNIRCTKACYGCASQFTEYPVKCEAPFKIRCSPNKNSRARSQNLLDTEVKRIRDSKELITRYSANDSSKSNNIPSRRKIPYPTPRSPLPFRRRVSFDGVTQDDDSSDDPECSKVMQDCGSQCCCRNETQCNEVHNHSCDIWRADDKDDVTTKDDDDEYDSAPETSAVYCEDSRRADYTNSVTHYPNLPSQRTPNFKEGEKDGCGVDKSSKETSNIIQTNETTSTNFPLKESISHTSMKIPNDDFLEDERMRGGCCGSFCPRCGGRPSSSRSSTRRVREYCPPSNNCFTCSRSKTSTTQEQDQCPSNITCGGCSSCCSERTRCSTCPSSTQDKPVCKHAFLVCRQSTGCGQGGCCGSGCRGGCGKPGQTCVPSSPCTIPPCRGRASSAGSTCSSTRSCPASQACCCSKKPMVSCSRRVCANTESCGCGNSGTSCCRPSSPGCRPRSARGCCSNDGGKLPADGASCCRPKYSGCECLGGGLDCQRCGRKVYQAEKQMVSGMAFHNTCFSCYCCRKPLEPLTYQENCGEIYCKQCYVRNFGPQGYGYGIGAGVLQTPL